MIRAVVLFSGRRCCFGLAADGATAGRRRVPARPGGAERSTEAECYWRCKHQALVPVCHVRAAAMAVKMHGVMDIMHYFGN